MMKSTHLCVLALSAFLAFPAYAGNAPWYRWESRIDGRLVCAQTLPHEGWKRLAGPFVDAACRRPR
ncbi:MAG: hypothetical protein K2X64_11525 [Rhodocyclaceae bacterium]|nr:hypothetical protein [Rhodocyclaceae bacterium]